MLSRRRKGVTLSRGRRVSSYLDRWISSIEFSLGRFLVSVEFAVYPVRLRTDGTICADIGVDCPCSLVRQDELRHLARDQSNRHRGSVQLPLRVCDLNGDDGQHVSSLDRMSMISTHRQSACHSASNHCVRATKRNHHRDLSPSHRRVHLRRYTQRSVDKNRD